MLRVLTLLVLLGTSPSLEPKAKPQVDLVESDALKLPARPQEGSASTLTPLASAPAALLQAKASGRTAAPMALPALAPTATRSWELIVYFDTNGDGVNDASQIYGIVKESYREVRTRQVGPYGEGLGLFGSNEGNVSYDPSSDPIASFMPYNYGTLIEMETPVYTSPFETPAYRLARPIGAEIDVYFTESGRSVYVPAYGIPLDVSATEAPAYHRPITVTITRRWDEWTVAHKSGAQYYALATIVVPTDSGVRFDTSRQFDSLLDTRNIDLDSALDAIDTTSSFLGAVAELSFADYSPLSKTDAAGSILALAEFLGGLTGLLNSEQQFALSAAGYALDLYEILFQGSATGFVGGLVMSSFLGRLMQASADMQAYQRALHITTSNYFAASLERAVYVGVDALTAQRPYGRIYDVGTSTWPLFPAFGSVIDDVYWGLYGPDGGGARRAGLWGTISNNAWYFLYTREPASVLFGAGAALGSLALDARQVPDVNGNGPDAIDLFANAFNTGHRAAQRFSELYFGSVLSGTQLILDESYYVRAINPATVYQTVLAASDGAATALVSYLSVLNRRFSYSIDTAMPGYAPDANVRSTVTIADDNMVAAMAVLGRIHGFRAYWGSFAYTDTDVNFAAADADGDGIPNADEDAAGTNKYAADTDGDGLDDGDEAVVGCFAARADSDSDGIADGAEDYDADGLTNHEELYVYRSNPIVVDPDLDLDGLGNSVEKVRGLDPGNRDSDGDGAIDGVEVNELGTDPLSGDTDRDGLLDGKEAVLFAATLGLDYDGDGRPDGPRDSDSDGDDRSDHLEYNAGTNLLGLNRAPSVVIEAPLAGASLSGTITIQARVRDADGFGNIASVRFYHSADGARWTELSGLTPGADGLWSRSFDTYLVPNGSRTFKAGVWDKEQAAATSTVQVTIANANRKPSCTVTQPNGGESIPCTSTTVSASASDPDVGDAVTKVEFEYSRDGTTWYAIGNDPDGANGWAVSWATSGLAGGPGCRVRARAYDGALYSDWDLSNATFTLACPYCGDGSCNGTETCSNCRADCGACAVCGDGICNENCSSCMQDCACKIGSCAGHCPGTSWTNKCKCPEGMTGYTVCSCSTSCAYRCGACLCPL